MDMFCADNGAHDTELDGLGGQCPHDEDYESERNDEDLSETEISQIKLYDGIKRMVEDSVEFIKKQRTERKKKRKRTFVTAGEACYNKDDTTAYSRCTLSYLDKVIKSITYSDHRVSLVRKMGFQETLHIDDCYIPRMFAQWIADKIIPDEEIIKFDEKSIPINAKSFQDVLGIPAGHLPVETDEETGKAAFLQFFGLSEVPPIKYFGDKIINNQELGDDEFCMCYGFVVLCCFICPNSSTKPSTKYMGALADVDNINNRNWCQFAHDWMMWYIKKYLKERAKRNKLTITLGGCIYKMAVRYLDFIDLGPIKMPSTLPRIRVWKGDLIKHFSEMDKGKDGNYGSHTVKDVSQTCYATPTTASREQECTHHLFKNEIARATGDLISNEVKDKLFNAFQSHMVDADPEIYLRTQVLVVDFLKIIALQGVSKVPSETTLVVSQETTEQGDEGNRRKKLRCNGNNWTDHLSQPNNVLDSKGRELCHQMQISGTKDNMSQQARSVELSFNRERSLSLNHTPSADAQSLHHSSNHERSFSLNHTASADEGGSPSSFSNRQVEPSVPEMEVKNVHTDEGNRQACYINTMPCLEQEYVDGDTKSEAVVSREEFLKEAIKKYHFNDPSYPSMRMFEDEDDNGKYIEEPELWRPLPGAITENENNNKDEEQELDVSNLNEKLQMNDGLVDGYYSPPHDENNSFAYSPPKQTTPAYKHNADTDFEFSTIQCAQKQTSYIGPSPHGDKTKEIIDLDSSSPLSHPSHLTPSRKEFSYNNIVGRRLFDDSNSTVGKENNLCPKSSDQKLKQQMSPELEYMGSRSFTSACKNMADKSDELYNAGLSLGSATMSFGKENVPPKRVINRSNWLRSPFEHNQRQVLDPNHVRLHKIITTICDDEDYQYKYIINIDNCKVFLKQLGNSMKEDGWVEAWVMNAFCRKLFKDNHPRKSQKHWFFHTSSEYFLEKWPSEMMRNKWREGTIKGFKGADSSRKLHLSHRLHFPSLYEGHWFLFIVDLLGRKFLFLDSYYGESSNYHNKIDNMMIENFKQTWNDCNLRNMGFENFDIFFPNVPKQKTLNDCGIFTMKLMEFYCPRNPSSISFSAIDIPDFRVQIAIDSVWNDYNTELETAYLISSFDLKAYQRIKHVK